MLTFRLVVEEVRDIIIHISCITITTTINYITTNRSMPVLNITVHHSITTLQLP
jgi:hypothetical protein